MKKNKTEKIEDPITSYKLRCQLNKMRLEKFQERVANSLKKEFRNDELKSICIYVTGSFGRGESSKYSDIDLFMVDTIGKANNSNQLSKLNQIILMADIIKICKSHHDFPNFIVDDRWLHLHLLSKLSKDLGSLRDDAENYFTARLLLILESKSVYNDYAYHHAVKNILEEQYFRDYAKYAENFYPIILANDIVRFWKTLCLNYEYERNEADVLNPQDPRVRAELKLKSNKLKFLRLMTCYSMLCTLLVNKCTLDNVIEAVKRTPVERLYYIVEQDKMAKPIIEKMLDQYFWYLRTLGEDKEVGLKWLSDPVNQKIAEQNAQSFGLDYYNLLTTVGRKKKEMLRYIFI